MPTSPQLEAITSSDHVHSRRVNGHVFVVNVELMHVRMQRFNAVRSAVDRDSAPRATGRRRQILTAPRTTSMSTACVDVDSLPVESLLIQVESCTLLKVCVRQY